MVIADHQLPQPVPVSASPPVSVRTPFVTSPICYFDFMSRFEP